MNAPSTAQPLAYRFPPVVTTLRPGQDTPMISDDAYCRTPPETEPPAPSQALIDRFALAQHVARRNARSHSISRALLPTARLMAAKTLAECAARGIRITLEDGSG